MIDKTIEAIEALPDAAECGVIRYTGDRIQPFGDVPDIKALAAKLKELRRIIAFYGIEIMPDGSFTSPRITQNEVDLKELREFVGAMESHSKRIQCKGGCEIVPRFDRWAVFDESGSIVDHYDTFREAFDAYRKMKAGEGE